MQGLPKKAVLVLARVLALPWSLLPRALRRGVISGLMLVESRAARPETALGRLFALADDLERLTNERATALGGGVHPKHGLTGYHDFFVDNVAPGSRILDVGCGIGEVARSLAGRVPDAEVTGIDSDPAMVARARRMDNPANLRFAHGDAAGDLPDGRWDAVVLSNVLEHMDDRVAVLQELARKTAADRLLIRVPLFERHWQVPMRRRLGIPYFSDPTHRIEHTLEEFRGEIADAGLEIETLHTLWGEIWARCRPK